MVTADPRRTPARGALLSLSLDEQGAPALDWRLGAIRLVEPALVRAIGRRGLAALAIGLGAAMLLWSALVNGRPSVFPDTALYYSQAEYLAEAVGLVNRTSEAVPAGDPTALPARPGQPNVSATIDGARSPVYGLFLYALQRLGGLWLVAAVQALVLSATLSILFRAAAPRAGERLFLAWMALLSATTSLPFFATFAMPDVLAGAAGAALLGIMVYWDRLSVGARGVCMAVLVFAICAHRSNLLTACATAGLGAAGLVALGVGRREAARRAAAVFASAALAGLASLLVFIPISRRAGEAVRDPPFLMARVIADGPGWRYLRHACGTGRPFTVCRFRSLPPEDSDTLLWSNHSNSGLFGVASYPVRLRLEQEEVRFVLGALAYDPLGQLLESGRNVGRQLAMTRVQSPLADPARFVGDAYWRRTSLARIIPDAAACRSPGRCASKIAAGPLEALQNLVLLGALAAGLGLGVTLARPAAAGGAAGDETRRVLAMLTLTAGFVLANAAVCGALSAPVARYQARLIWLLPAVVMLAFAALRQPEARSEPV